MATTLDPRLTHFLVADRGEWGIGTTIAQAAQKRPYSKRRTLSADAVVYRVPEGSYVSEDAQLITPKGMPKPIEVDPKTGERKGLKTKEQVRREFAAYYLDLRASQERDGAAVPSKFDEWEKFVRHLFEEDQIPLSGTSWPCPRNLEAEMKKDG